MAAETKEKKATNLKHLVTMVNGHQQIKMKTSILLRC
jgi:hypothetical protein